MQLFKRRELRQALQYAAEGGQALFIHKWTGGDDSPKHFRYSQMIGKLFDHDKKRLIQAAYSLGIHIIKIDREDTEYQHIDLARTALERALMRAEKDI